MIKYWELLLKTGLELKFLSIFLSLLEQPVYIVSIVRKLWAGREFSLALRFVDGDHVFVDVRVWSGRLSRRTRGICYRSAGETNVQEAFPVYKIASHVPSFTFYFALHNIPHSLSKVRGILWKFWHRFQILLFVCNKFWPHPFFLKLFI